MPDGLLDELPLPALSAALAPAPGGFTVADHVAKVHVIGGQDRYTTRQAAYDLPSCAASSSSPSPAGPGGIMHAGRHLYVAALLTLLDHVIAPILAGVRSPDRPQA